MPSKSTKKSRRAGDNKQSHAPAEKDDGTRWRVIDDNGQTLYLTSGGVTKAQAERLAQGLRAAARIEQI